MNTHDKINKLLAAFALGELSPQQSAEVETHLAECHRCKDELINLKALLECTESMRRLSADDQVCESARQTLLEAAARHEETATPKPAALLESLWRTIMNTKRLKLAAAAAIVLGILAVSYFLPDNSLAPRAFGEVLRNVINAESISFHSKQKLGMGPAMVFRMYIRGQRIRGDLVAVEGDQKGLDQLQKEMKERKLSALMSYITDLERKDGIEIDHFRKTYKKINIDDRMAAEFTKTNPIEQFCDVKSEDAERIGEESQDGRMIDVYLVRKVNLMGIKAELSGQEKERMTVRVDRITGMPVRILLQASFDAEGKSEGSIEFYDFTWNEPLEQDLFDLNPPEGYTLSTGPDFPTE